MAKLPVDAAPEKVIQALKRLGFRLLREGGHISMARKNTDGVSARLTIPNHRRIKGSTLHTVLTHACIPTEDFLNAYEPA